MRKRARAGLAPRADVDLRGSSRLVAPRPGRPLLELPRDRRAARRVCGGPRLHARRAAARDRAPARRVLGLPVHRLLRADAPPRLAGRAPRPRRRAARARHRRAARLGARPFSEGRARAQALRRHAALRVRRHAKGRAPRLGHARVQLLAQRSTELPIIQRDLLARRLPLRRSARRRGRVHALSGLLAPPAPVDARTNSAATRTSRRSRS